MGPMMLPVAFAGPPLATFIQDQTGSNQLAFQIGLALLLAAAALALPCVCESTSPDKPTPWGLT